MEFMTTRIIRDVQSKPGVPYNPYHSELLERPCIILDAEVGHCAWLAVETERDPGVLHRFRTSPVISVEVEADDAMRIETKNTVYTIDISPDDRRSVCLARFTLDDYKIPV